LTPTARNSSTGPHAHETPDATDTGRTPLIRHTRTRKTRRAKTHGTAKTVRRRSTSTPTRDGTPTWTRPIWTPTTGSSGRTDANAPAFEDPYANSGQGATRLVSEIRIIRCSVLDKARNGSEEPSRGWPRCRDGLGPSLGHDVTDSGERPR